MPLRQEELAGIRVEVSVLSTPETLEFDSEANALARLRPGPTASMLEYGSRRSTFLPQVWEQLPQPADFLFQLKRKAACRATSGTTGCGCSATAWQVPGERMSVDHATETAASAHRARWWHALDDGRLQCDLCPRDCRLHEGQRGACFVRQRVGDAMVLSTYGRSSGFCIDPIEKKPLNHFHPGSSVLSFGTAGCNLACKFCQNWDISKSRDMDRLMDQASPPQIAQTAARHGCTSVAFTYNDPVIFAEYALDVADACHAPGIRRSRSRPATSTRRRGASSSPGWTRPTSTSRPSARTSTSS